MFKNMKIGVRLALSFSIMLVLIIILIIIELNSIEKIHGNLRDIVNIENARTKLANNMIGDVREVSIALRTILLDKDIAVQVEQKKNIEDLRKSYDSYFIKYEDLVPKEQTKILYQISKVKILRDESRGFNNTVVDLATVGKYDAALDTMLVKARPKVKEWIDAVNEMINLESESTQLFYENSNTVYTNLRLYMFILGVIAFILFVTISILITLSITQPLKIATNLVMSRDLSIDLSAYQKGGGELGLM